MRMANLKRSALAFGAAGGEIKQAHKKKNLESAYVAAGGEIMQSNNQPVDNGQRKRVTVAQNGVEHRERIVTPREFVSLVAPRLIH